MISGLRSIASVLVCANAVLGHTEARAGELATDVKALLGASKLDPRCVGYSIIDLDNSAVLAKYNEQLALIPASNAKVLTTGAALITLGADFNFETRLVCTTVNGHTTLTLVGSGDPALFDAQMIRSDGSHGNWTTVGAASDAWTSALIGAGIRSVDEFVVDARIFDEESIPQGDLKWKTNSDAGTYAVGVWGLNIAANAAIVTPTWTPGARPSLASVEPPFPLAVSKNDATCQSKQKESFGIGYEKAANALTFYGNLTKRGGTFAVAIHNPLPLTAAMFAQEFTKRGVAVQRWRVAGSADPVALGATVLPVLTTPIATVLRGANTESKNIYAEGLAKRMGAARANGLRGAIGPTSRPGSLDLGMAALSAAIDGRLAPRSSESISLIDASGLSDKNRVNADVTARWIAAIARDGALMRSYIGSFARPGEQGTLKNRFKDARFQKVAVYGKSGYINGVSCLSGIVIATDSGQSIVYSILCNGLTGNVAQAKALHESIVNRIAKELESRSARTAAAKSN